MCGCVGRCECVCVCMYRCDQKILDISACKGKADAVVELKSIAPGTLFHITCTPAKPNAIHNREHLTLTS